MISSQIFSSVRFFLFVLFGGGGFFLFSGYYVAVAVKKDAFRICISVSSARDSHLNIGPLGAGLGWPGTGAPAAAAPGLPHPPPPPTPHHCIQRAAPGLPAALRLGRGPGGRGSRAGQGTSSLQFPPPPPLPGLEGVGSGVPGRMNGLERAGGAHCSGPGVGVAISFFPTLSQLLSPPPSRGARRGRGLGRKEPGKGGVGAGRRGVGGGEGGSGGLAALCRGGALRCGRGACLPILHLRSPLLSAAVKACLSLDKPRGPFPREALGWR